MLRLIVPIGVLALASNSLAQVVYSEVSLNNSFSVIAGQDPVTNNNRPWGPTTPSGYYGTGVLAGTRAWTWTPKERFQGGSNPNGNYLTVMGFTQGIFVGPAIPATSYPTTTETYQFATGIAPVDPYTPGVFRHAANASTADVIYVPASTYTATSHGIYDHTFQLTTPMPISIGDDDLCLFVEYNGGEKVDDPAGGQTLAAEWKGAFSETRTIFYGFTQPPAGGSRLVYYSGQYESRGKIGLLVDEPVFHATGFHASRYDGVALPAAGETYLGVAAYTSDWAQGTMSNSLPTLFFHFEGGSRYDTGFGWYGIAFNLGPSWFPGRIPYQNWGFVQLNIFDPLLYGFMQAGQAFQAGPGGTWNNGPNQPSYIPLFGPQALGESAKMQAFAVNLDPAGVRDVLFTNSSSIVLIR